MLGRNRSATFRAHAAGVGGEVVAANGTEAPGALCSGTLTLDELNRANRYRQRSSDDQPCRTTGIPIVLYIPFSVAKPLSETKAKMRGQVAGSRS